MSDSASPSRHDSLYTCPQLDHANLCVFIESYDLNGHRSHQSREAIRLVVVVESVEHFDWVIDQQWHTKGLGSKIRTSHYTPHYDWIGLIGSIEALKCRYAILIRRVVCAVRRRHGRRDLVRS
jgi:hypothetical protein